MTALSAFLPNTVVRRCLTALKVKQVELCLKRQRARVRRDEAFRITHELGNYTDRQLADLGLSRFEIPSVACGTYSRA